MDLSVVIAARNATPTLTEQLDALAHQRDAGAFEVIVVDNDSTDGTPALVREYARTHPPLALRCIEAGPPPEQGRARNIGVAEALAERVAFCDADDIVTEGWVHAMTDALDRHEFVTGPCRLGRINPAWAIEARPYIARDDEEPQSPWHPCASGCNMGVRKARFRQVDGFHRHLGPCEDSDLSWRLHLVGVRLHFDPRAIVDYRLRQTLRSVYEQARHYATYYVLLNRRFEPHGMPNLIHSPKRLLLDLAKLAVALPRHGGSKSRLARWLFLTGWHRGLLRGQLRYRSVPAAPLPPMVERVS